MSMEFGFAVVPFKCDGQLNKLYHHETPNSVDSDQYLKDGVKHLEAKDEKSYLACGLNENGINNINFDTHGAFIKLIGGRFNQQYILLDNKKEELKELKAAIPETGTTFRREFLQILVDNCEAVLKEHGNKAALIIF